MVPKRVRMFGFLLASVGLVGLALGTDALSNGPRTGGLDVSTDGCNCHSATPNPMTAITFTGLPETYTPGQVIDLTVSSTTDVVAVEAPQNHGGFVIQATAGTFAARGTTQAGWVQTGANPPYIEHTKLGETTNAPVNGVQTWQVTWTAPSSGDMTFNVWVNRVNGDGSNSAADHWNTVSDSVKGPAAGGKNGSPGFGLVAGLLGGALAVAYFSGRR